MSMVLLDAALRRLVTHGTLTVTDASGRQRRYGTSTPGWPDLGLRLHDRRVPGALARNPSLGMAECFMDGRLTIEHGDIMDFVGFIRRNNPWNKGGDLDNLNVFDKLRVAITGRLDQINQRNSSRRNVAHHYDLDDRLYDLFLDPARQYSCAYWDEGITSLEDAQRAKMEHIAAKLALKPGMRVLDIGCGWGGLALHLHRISGASIHGISLSKEQIGYAQAWAAREGVADKVTFSLTDYRDQVGPFDRIVSVGMFEHVGVPNYPTFFRKCHDLLAPDGVMLLHTIGRAGPPNITDDFTRKYIFPGGYIPSLSETMTAVEPCKLMLTDCEILRRHYALTLRAWYARCAEQEETITAIYDARFFRMWQFYLAGAATGFEHADLVNFQLQFVRNRDALPLTRDYIGTAEAGYRAARSHSEAHNAA